MKGVQRYEAVSRAAGAHSVSCLEEAARRLADGEAGRGAGRDELIREPRRREDTKVGTKKTRNIATEDTENTEAQSRSFLSVFSVFSVAPPSVFSSWLSS